MEVLSTSMSVPEANFLQFHHSLDYRTYSSVIFCLLHRIVIIVVLEFVPLHKSTLITTKVAACRTNERTGRRNLSGV